MHWIRNDQKGAEKTMYADMGDRYDYTRVAFAIGGHVLTIFDRRNAP